jgi:L-lactate dehydrogenase complex protein LldF
MSTIAKTFLEKSKAKAENLEHRYKINFNIGKYQAQVPQGQSQFSQLETARQRAKNIKWRALENLEQMLELFETVATKNGVQVLWAETVEDAQQHVYNICKEANCTTLVKSKSMVTEEIGLNHFLEKNNIESVETDLGEYIQQLDGEAPYHIVTPAMHKSKEDVAKLFTEKLGTPSNLNPTELTLVARAKLREKYTQAQVGVTGANFLIAETGSIAVTENEGNARLSVAFPNVHIAIAGIEKIIPNLNDLVLFWSLLSSYGTGQKLTVYNSIISGPKQASETNGPQKMYVILLDNGRTNILANPVTRESLYCIRCGACLNACPVYKNIGGHAYGTTYSGPIGSVITPNLKSLPDYKHLSYASSLCGHCTQVCAVKINLHELLLYNREASVQEGDAGFLEKTGWGFWQKAMLSRKLMNTGTSGIKQFIVNNMVKGWKGKRDSLDFPAKSFNEIMRAKK